MINRVLEFSLKQKGLVVSVLLIILITGGLYYVQLPRSSFPKVTIPSAVVTVMAPGLTAEEIEKEITDEIEYAVMDIPGFKESSSQSMNNASAIVVRLKNELSEEEVRNSFLELRQKMNDLKSELPTTVSSINVNTDLANSASLILAISSKDISNEELSQRAKELQDKLTHIKGVSKVKVIGDIQSQISIVVDTKKLNQLNLSMTELVQMIGSNNSIVPIGKISLENDESISVSSSGRFNSLKQIRDTIIGFTENGTIINLGDIAEIKYDSNNESPYYRFNGTKSVAVALYFHEGLNIVSLGDETRTAIEAFKSSLPETIEVNEVYVQPDDVKKDIDNFLLNLIEAIVIVMVVVMIGMNFRNGLVVSLAIPLSISANFIIMKLVGEQIHFMSLTALIMVLGMLVDNSVVVSDSIQTYIDLGFDKAKACIQGTKDVAISVFLSMTTAVLTFASMLTMSGVNRQVIIAIPIVIISCLVLSYLISIFVTPLFCYLFLKQTDISKKHKVTLSQKIYTTISKYSFRYKKKSIILSIALTLIFGIGMVNSTMDIMPKVNKEYILVDIKNYKTDNLKLTEELVNKIEDIIKDQPETVNYFSGVGVGIPSYSFAVNEKGKSSSLGDICIKIDLRKGGRFKTTAEMINYLQNEFNIFQDKAYIVVNQIGIVPETGSPIGVNIYGEDINKMNEIASEITLILKEIDGLTAVSDDSYFSSHDYYMNMNSQRMNVMGLMKAAVQNELNIAISGRNAATTYDNGKEYNINIKSDISSLSDFENYKIKSSNGLKYMTKQFADFEINSKPNTIKHIEGERVISVGGYPELGYNSGKLQREFINKIKELNIPDGVTVDIEPSKDASEAMGAMGMAGALSMILIFFVLYLQFKSIKQLFLIFSSIPIGVVSGMAAVHISGYSLSFFVMLGVISMLGIVLANAIVLVDYINQERKEGLNLEEACKTAGEKRLRPILMSTMTTVLGLIPLALSGQVLFVPLAILLMSSLTFCMIFNLIMVPILYSILENEDNSFKIALPNIGGFRWGK
ncbi:efflux RND transporter permease subunit [Acetoanaerobium sticklandii]|uniref:efflux RND transporter permease subunit n=1 Tax=Acetoanaerobium sticklandii TaxID=1511 RepID=UPI003A927776